MTTSQKLHLIQRATGLSQQQLANKLGVTFAAFNRWINEKAQPRAAMLKNIDELYLEVTGQKKIPADVLLAKKDLVTRKCREHTNILQMILRRPDIKNQFLLSLTYNSNRIEGSTLTEKETAAIIFDNQTIPDKSMVEHLEAKNHQTAMERMFEALLGKRILDEDLILELHRILMNGILPDAGFYRRHAVRIVGANVPTANYLKIPDLMPTLIHLINSKTDDTIGNIAKVHSDFERIHPFTDGNGRIGRLMMNFQLLKANLAPALIAQSDRQKYFTVLNTSQIKEDSSLLEDFLCEAVLEGLKIVEGF